MLAGAKSRHSTFKFCLDPTVEQHEVLAACRRGTVRVQPMPAHGKTAFTQRKTRPDMVVPWSGLI
jgi:putative transposase